MIAAISRTRLAKRCFKNGLFLMGDKSPAFFLILHAGCFTAMDARGADVCPQKVETLCPGSLDQMRLAARTST
ncbi:MAG: hypothetical protein JXR14_04730 [Paracoccaceae bacterium]